MQLDDNNTLNRPVHEKLLIFRQELDLFGWIGYANTEKVEIFHVLGDIDT